MCRRGGKGIAGEMYKMKDFAPSIQARVWAVLGSNSENKKEQLNALMRAVEALSATPLQKVEHLVTLGEWLYCSGYPLADAEDQLMAAIDLLMDCEEVPDDDGDDGGASTVMSQSDLASVAGGSDAGGGRGRRRFGAADAAVGALELAAVVGVVGGVDGGVGEGEGGRRDAERPSLRAARAHLPDASEDGGDHRREDRVLPRRPPLYGADMAARRRHRHRQGRRRRRRSRRRRRRRRRGGGEGGGGGEGRSGVRAAARAAQLGGVGAVADAARRDEGDRHRTGDLGGGAPHRAAHGVLPRVRRRVPARRRHGFARAPPPLLLRVVASDVLEDTTLAQISALRTAHALQRLALPELAAAARADAGALRPSAAQKHEATLQLRQIQQAAEVAAPAAAPAAAAAAAAARRRRGGGSRRRGRRRCSASSSPRCCATKASGRRRASGSGSRSR